MRLVTRKERKYLTNLVSAKRLEALLDRVLIPDKYNGPTGYRIRSLYFDTIHDRDFHEKVQGIHLRRKIRLRLYDPKGDFALLEVKQKQGEDQMKRSLPLDRAEAMRIVRGDYDGLLERPEPFAKEVHALILINGYVPKTIVEYRRKAFVAKENRIRLTFDSDIRATETHLDPFDPELCLTPVFDPFNVVLEVKYNGFLLSYIRGLLNTIDASELSTSKYALARSFTYGYDT